MVMFCLAAAFLVLWMFSRFGGFGPERRPLSGGSIGFLVDRDGHIVDASPMGETVLAKGGPSSQRKWALLHRLFQTRFAALPRNFEDARAMAPARLPALSPEDPAVLVLETQGSALNLRLEDQTEPTTADRHLHLHFLQQLSIINNVVDMFPYPVWMKQHNGQPYWINRAYSQLLDKVRTGPETGEIAEFDMALTADQGSRTARRLVQDPLTGRSHWFNVTNSDTGNGNVMGFAIDIDPVIEAELAQRNFVQTLTKTFAQLSTGLAIFDRERQLALFNPALIDLLALPAEFLSARPTLLTFFDKLRDNRMMPEPKNYANWRHQITDLVIASVDGRYQETWTLPSGLTYRVTGRPHPDGAVALLFEDISAEISLTRRFRSQLNLGQAVIDTLDEAVAVFTSSGALTLSNQAFHRMWKMDPDTSFAEVTIRDALAQWQSLAEPGPFWARLHGYFVDSSDRSEWYADVRLKSGTQLECRVAPVSGGATLVGFRMRPVMGAATASHEEGTA
jgi:PAS domain-containing protein